MRRRPCVLLLASALALTACGGSDEPAAGQPAVDSDALQVATAFYPLQFLVERVGGSAVEVENLSPPGAEPHDLELSPQQVARLSEADLVVYLAGFQPAVDDAVEQSGEDRALEATSAVELDGEDPHVWLDPTRYAELAVAVAERLSELDPERSADFTSGADALRGDLEELDAAFRDGLATCERRELVTAHDAFGYLARAYDLEQVPVTGLTPEDEPSPGRLAEVAELARASGVTTIFFEDTASPKVAEALASEVGAASAVLTPLESQPAQGDYLSAMQDNLVALQDALGCSTP